MTLSSMPISKNFKKMKSIMKSNRIIQIINIFTMKKPNFTRTIFSAFGLAEIMKTRRAFSILITLILIQTIDLTAQVDCNSVMGCGGKVNISMDDDCTLNIEPDMILDDQAYGNQYYDVEAKLNGVLLPSVSIGTLGLNPIKRPVVSRIHVGKTLEVRVILRGCSNSCWGLALIEDKLAPEPTVCPCVTRITRFRDTIEGNGPVYLRPISSFCTNPSDPILPARSDFKVFQFALSANGTVDINIGLSQGSLPNPLFTLYSGNFNAITPCLNKVTNNINSASLALLSGVNYYLVVAVLDGVVDVPFNVAIEHRTGHILPNANANTTVCSLQCNSEAELLAQTALNAQNKPVFVDNCTSFILTKSDQTESLGCESRFSKIIKRTWIATDSYGNKSEPKIQYFYVERIKLSEVMCPDSITLECSNYPKLASGAPDPAFTGMPTNLNCQNIQVYYEDIVFPLCGNGVKVVRSWNIIDWCSGEDKVCLQAIKIADNRGPVVTCPADISTQGNTTPIRPAEVVSVGHNCKANWPVLPPIAVTDCSKLTWEVAFKKADSNGKPPANATFIKIDGATIVIGNKPAFATTISQTARPFRIEGLPLGRTWLRYTITDECGNSTDCFTEIDVVDSTPPTAICHGTTAVTIDESGIAEVFAESLDDYSTDNCGVVKYEIKRNAPTCTGFGFNTNFGPSIKVCCKDVTATSSFVPVTLRVYDSAGNFNDCDTRLTIQLKRPLSLECPNPRSLNCSDPKATAWVAGNQPFDTLFFGKPSLSGICVTGGIFSSRIISDTRTAKCGVGTVTREWTLVSNPSLKCQQTVTLTTAPFNSNNVIFPKDTILNTCNPDLALPEILNSRPIVPSAACRDLGISSTDQLFYDVPGFCSKIIRTWKVIDWCTYQSSGLVIEATQTIKLRGTDAPKFTECKAVTFDTDINRCDTEVNIISTATDGCTDALEIKYTWKIDINKDGTFNANGIGNRITRILEVGTHQVVFTAENRCGKITECKYDVIIRSNKKPTPICLREVVWVLDPSGTTEIWAADFNLKSEGSCGSTSNLKFAFNSAGTELAKTFRCSDIPNGQLARIPLKMYVIDKYGNFDFCDVILILQDSPLNNKCTDISSLLPTVQGRIATDLDKGLDQIEVVLTNMQNANALTDMTENQGFYKFEGVDVFDPKSIEANNNLNHLNGVSTLDLVMIQRHILGINKLDSPYKMLAADINNSHSITASDLVNLRKLILGISAEFENNTSWRFVPKNYIFEELSNPFNYTSKINLDSLFEDKDNVDFIAIKVGDINQTVVANAQDARNQSRTQSAPIHIASSEFNSGEIVKIDITAGQDMDVIGAQLALKFDIETLHFEGIQSGKIDIKSNQYVDLNDVIRISNDMPKGVSVKSEDVLFTLIFTSKLQGTTELKLDESSISAEVYDNNGYVKTLDLQIRNVGESGGQNILYQNEPNPFKENTKIAFELEKEGKATIKVIDVNGKVVFQKNNEYQKGYNVVLIDANTLQSSGVYYYQIDAEGFSATRKMIMIK
jgi:Secretion system C-terminal sorting domain